MSLRIVLDGGFHVYLQVISKAFPFSFAFVRFAVRNMPNYLREIQFLLARFSILDEISRVRRASRRITLTIRYCYRSKSSASSNNMKPVLTPLG